MPITAKCTVEHGMIKLPPSLGFSDGTKVLVNIHTLTTKQNKRSKMRELAGAWCNDPSIKELFATIESERHSYFGRDNELLK